MTAMRFYWLVLGVLCVWRITHLLVAEDGPGDVLARLRAAAGGGFWGKLLDCFYCLSLWVAAPLAAALGQSWAERFLLWPSLSAGAILLERLGAKARPALYREDSEDTSELLRESETRSSAGRDNGPAADRSRGLL
jgi:hypothetical protein